MSLEHAPQRTPSRAPKTRRLLSPKAAAAKTGDSLSTFWRKVGRGTYAQPIYPDGSNPKFIENEIDEAIERAVQERASGKLQGRLRKRKHDATRVRMERRAAEASGDA
jgi:predicted DNA-binding transcriptional regulator AlpA